MQLQSLINSPCVTCFTLALFALLQQVFYVVLIWCEWALNEKLLSIDRSTCSVCWSSEFLVAAGLGLVVWAGA